jgi:hypothetical protein
MQSADENLVDRRDSSMGRGSEIKESGSRPPMPANHSDINFDDQFKLRQNNQTALNGSLINAASLEANGRSSNPILLDERSLLACLVRAIPSEASARIKISTTVTRADTEHKISSHSFLKYIFC